VRARLQLALGRHPAGAAVPAAVLRLAPPVQAAPSRPADAVGVRGLACLLQYGEHRLVGAARLPRARLPAAADADRGVPPSCDAGPAAHAAAVAWDLLTMVGLFLLGRRRRAGPAGRALGVALAFAWAAYPYSLFVLSNNSNDAFVSATVVFALVAIASGPVRG